MSQPIVPSITDEQLAQIQYVADHARRKGVLSGINITPETMTAVIARLRAAEKDAARYRLFSSMSGQISKGVWLKGPERFLFESMSSVETVTEEQLAAMFDTAMEQQP